MGRHSAPEATPFLRSIVAWALPWMLIVGVVVVALLVALRMVEDEPVRATRPATDATAPEPGGAGAGDDEGEPADEDRQEEDNDRKRKPERAPTDRPDTPLVAEGLDLQVLNGTGDATADDLLADKLARLGYSVVAVSPSARAYPKTVVFWVGERDDAARALAERFGWSAEPAPANLSQEVDLHVVVGADSL